MLNLFLDGVLYVGMAAKSDLMGEEWGVTKAVVCGLFFVILGIDGGFCVLCFGLALGWWESGKMRAQREGRNDNDEKE